MKNQIERTYYADNNVFTETVITQEVNAAGNPKGEKLQHLYQLLENWLPDLETYREIITTPRELKA